jgi:uncharacterized protein (DUF486 family)
MEQLLKSVSGYKTYIVAILLVVSNVGVQFGWFTQDHVNLVNAILAPLGLAFLRAGVNSAVAKVAGK